jgi:hypothetical protein
MSLQSYVTDILFGSGRGLGTLIPNVVIEESHDDELEITDHPVDRSADITDNSFRRPSALQLRYGWAPGAPLVGGLVGTILPVTSGLVSGVNQVLNAGDDYLTSIYQKLRDLQATRQPFTITTGKRVYENMLLRRISFTTTAETEYSMIVTLLCREVQLVSVTTTNLAPQSSQAEPQQTSPTVDKGAVAPVPAKNTSVLKGIFKGFTL